LANTFPPQRYVPSISYIRFEKELIVTVMEP
jgi:hypothetical protein